MDCSFTLLVGVFGVSRVGTVPPADLFTPAVPPFFVGAIPRSSLDELLCGAAAAARGLSKLCACDAVCEAVCVVVRPAVAILGFSSLDFNLEALPSTL